jgi:hypothetical protein
VTARAVDRLYQVAHSEMSDIELSELFFENPFSHN